jgi:hypothetical protein
MHGICFDYELQEWFEFKIPKTKISGDYIFNALEVADDFNIKSAAKIVWLGGKPSVSILQNLKGNSDMMSLTFHDKKKKVLLFKQTR